MTLRVNESYMFSSRRVWFICI